MRYFLLLSALILMTPLTVFAQQEEEDDPFKRDPIFTKPIEDFFNVGEDDQDEGEIDSESDLKPRRVARRLSVRGVDLGGDFEAGPYYSNELYSQYPNLSMIHYNRVNGLFLGIRKERMQWHRSRGLFNINHLHPHGFIGYGTASADWEYAIGAERLFGEKKHFMVGGEFHRASATEDFNRVGLVETSLTSFFAANDFQDYYQMEGFGFYAAYRTTRWFEAAFSFTSDTFRSLETNTTYSLFGKRSIVRPNPPIDRFSDEIDLDRFGVSFEFNPRNVLITDTFTFSLLVAAELANNDGSDTAFRYDKYWSDLKIHYNFEPGSVLRWKVSAGGITGRVPDFKQFYLGGIGTLRGSPFKFFSGNQMLSSNAELQFGRPGRNNSWIRLHNLHLLLFLDSGWARQIPEMTVDSNPFEGFKQFEFADLQHDAGIGIGNGLFRFELAWPLKEFDNSPTLWVRLNPTF